MPKVENLSRSVTPAAPPVMPKVENLSPASGTQSRAPATTETYASRVLIPPKVENLSPASGTQSRTPATTGTYASHVPRPGPTPATFTSRRPTLPWHRAACPRSSPSSSSCSSCGTPLIPGSGNGPWTTWPRPIGGSTLTSCRNW
jgi:hypothetical protein